MSQKWVPCVGFLSLPFSLGSLWEGMEAVEEPGSRASLALVAALFLFPAGHPRVARFSALY